MSVIFNNFTKFVDEDGDVSYLMQRKQQGKIFSETFLERLPEMSTSGLLYTNEGEDWLDKDVKSLYTLQAELREAKTNEGRSKIIRIVLVAVAVAVAALAFVGGVGLCGIGLFAFGFCVHLLVVIPDLLLIRFVIICIWTLGNLFWPLLAFGSFGCATILIAQVQEMYDPNHSAFVSEDSWLSPYRIEWFIRLIDVFGYEDGAISA